MSWFTNIRDTVEKIYSPVTSFGGLTGGGGSSSQNGLMSLFGNGMFGNSNLLGGSTGDTTGQYGSLMDMLGQYGQFGPVNQTGSANLNSQGLI